MSETQKEPERVFPPIPTLPPPHAREWAEAGSNGPIWIRIVVSDQGAFLQQHGEIIGGEFRVAGQAYISRVAAAKICIRICQERIGRLNQRILTTKAGHKLYGGPEQMTQMAMDLDLTVVLAKPWTVYESALGRAPEIDQAEDDRLWREALKG